MTFEEFSKRTNEVAKARKIFIPNLTNNITEAFRLYQEVLAEEEMEVSISSAVGGNRPQTPFDDLIRPKCEECGVDMMLMVKVGDMDGKVWNTAWHCNKCLTDVYSDKTIDDWMRELKIADHAKK